MSQGNCETNRPGRPLSKTKSNWSKSSTAMNAIIDPHIKEIEQILQANLGKKLGNGLSVSDNAIAAKYLHQTKRYVIGPHVLAEDTKRKFNGRFEWEEDFYKEVKKKENQDSRKEWIASLNKHIDRLVSEFSEPFKGKVSMAEELFKEIRDKDNDEEFFKIKLKLALLELPVSDKDISEKNRAIKHYFKSYAFLLELFNTIKLQKVYLRENRGVFNEEAVKLVKELLKIKEQTAIVDETLSNYISESEEKEEIRKRLEECLNNISNPPKRGRPSKKSSMIQFETEPLKERSIEKQKEEYAGECKEECFSNPSSEGEHR